MLHWSRGVAALVSACGCRLWSSTGDCWLKLAPEVPPSTPAFKPGRPSHGGAGPLTHIRRYMSLLCGANPPFARRKLPRG